MLAFLVSLDPQLLLSMETVPHLPVPVPHLEALSGQHTGTTADTKAFAFRLSGVTFVHCLVCSIFKTVVSNGLGGFFGRSGFRWESELVLVIPL